MKQKLFIQLTVLVVVGFLVLLSGLVPTVYAEDPIGENENIELVSQLWGGHNAFFIEGNTAYISGGSKLVILDITNPISPSVVGKTAASPGFIERIFVLNNRAYVIDAYQGLRIIDVSTPSSPSELGNLPWSGEMFGIYVVGTTAYVATGSSGLRIIDVSNAAAPTELGFYNTPGSADNVYVSGTKAYVADGGSGLRIIDISSPASPTELGFYQTPIADGGSAGDVSVVNNTAYVTYDDAGLRVIDVSDAANPTELGQYPAPPEGFTGVYAADNNTVYLTVEDEGLHIINVSTPASPTLIGVEPGDEPGGEGVHVVSNYAYVVNRGGTLRVLDISNPTAPNQVGIYEGIDDLDRPYVVDNKAYIGYQEWEGGGMRILDVSDPAAPALLGAFTDFHVGNIVVSGTLAHITNGNFHTFDVSDPVTPTMLSYLSGDPSGTWDLAVVGDKAYVANGEAGLRIIDISTPTNPISMSTYSTPDRAQDVFVSGSRAYVAAADAGLRIIDISNPNSPVELGAYTDSGAGSVHVAGNIAYVTDFGDSPNSGLLLIDVSNPSNPNRLSIFNTRQASDIYVVGNIAYFVDEGDGLYVLDVSDPVAPQQMGYFYLGNNPFGVYVDNGIAYVNTEHRGLYLLRFTGEPPTFTASGQVTDGGSPVPGVTISTNKGQQTATNSSGVYTLSNLVEGNYTLTPYKAGYTFLPVTRSVAISPSVSGQNFAATPIVYTGTITGQVTAAGSTPISNILVLAYQNQGGTWFGAGSTTTGDGGNYALSLPIGGYRLYFADPAQNYANEYYNNQTTLNTATDVTVSNGATTVNINVELAAFPAPQVEISGDVSTSQNYQTGEMTIRTSLSASNQVTVTREITCASGSPSNVTLLVGPRTFAMTDGSNNQYSAILTLPDDLPEMTGTDAADLSVQYQCDTPIFIPVGKIVLHDPSGQITNASGQPIAGAIVNLYRVAGALPDKDGQTYDCRTVNTRPGGSSGDWSGVPAASLDAGNWVNPDLYSINDTAEINPTINPQVTGSDGRFAWDTVEGCWYVVVEAKGYETKTSALVGVPPEVTDLNIALTGGERDVYLPIILK